MAAADITLHTYLVVAQGLLFQQRNGCKTKARQYFVSAKHQPSFFCCTTANFLLLHATTNDTKSPPDTSILRTANIGVLESIHRPANTRHGYEQHSILAEYLAPGYLLYSLEIPGVAIFHGVIYVPWAVFRTRHNL